MLVEERALPAREHAFGARRAVKVDLLDRQAAQLGGERARVADRGAREAEGRVRSVVLADTPKPPQHVRDVAPEDPALGVELVDHDVAQAHHEGCPPLMGWQDPDVEHVGVGEHDVRVLARPRAIVGVGIAVECDRAHPGDEPRAQRAQLVVGERFRGKEEERGVTPVGHDGLDDGNLITQRFPRSGAGGDDDARTRAQPVDRSSLVGVELIYAARGDAVGNLAE